MTGPLHRLLGGLGLDDKLPPIEAPKRIDVMPVRLNPETLLGNKPLPDDELESYLDCNGTRCWRPKGEGGRMRLENRARSNANERARLAGIEREILGRKLDRIDPDWTSKFLSTTAAARFYRDELAEFDPRPGLVVHSSPFEPSTVVDAPYQDPDRE